MNKGFATILVLLVVVLVGGVGVGWYLSQQGVIPKFTGPATTEQPPAPPEVPEGNETANWKTYTNGDLKIQFDYPVSWNKLKEGGEPCFEKIGESLNYDKVVDRVNGELCKHISVKQNGHVFLAAQSLTFPDRAPGRGGYWGDGPAFEIRKEAWLPEQWLSSYCKEHGDYVHRCTLQKNPHGISYVKNLGPIQIQGESDKTAFYYYVYKPNSPFPIISLSNQDLESSLASEEIFDQILSTFRFLP